VSAPPLLVPPSGLDPVVRALTYPYPAPDHDYIFRAGMTRPVTALTPDDRSGRVPVLAIGSNRAPEQLRRKYADMPGAEIAVERIWLDGFDVVYSAHLSSYGAVAATLLAMPATRVEISVTWIPPHLMGRMHATEGIGTFYDYVELHGLSARSVAGNEIHEAFGYVCRLGALNLDGAARALSAIPATGRTLPALDQRQVQEAVIRKLGLATSLEIFIRESVADAALREIRERKLAADSFAFAWPGASLAATQ